MASLALTTVCPKSQVLARHQNLRFSLTAITGRAACRGLHGGSFGRLIYPSKGEVRHLYWPLSAANKGLETSITDQKKNDISLGDVKIVVESRDDEKINLRVDLTREGTQKAFDDVLVNLARTAPPIPGFRKMKGGKTSNVPKSFLLQILGRSRVTKFLIDEIVSTSIGDYVEKENLKVKSQFKTTQTAEELEVAFTPGHEFGFNATVEIEKAEETSPDSETSSNTA